MRSLPAVGGDAVCVFDPVEVCLTLTWVCPTLAGPSERLDSPARPINRAGAVGGGV